MFKFMLCVLVCLRLLAFLCIFDFVLIWSFRSIKIWTCTPWSVWKICIPTLSTFKSTTLTYWNNHSPFVLKTLRLCIFLSLRMKNRRKGAFLFPILWYFALFAVRRNRRRLSLGYTNFSSFLDFTQFCSFFLFCNIFTAVKNTVIQIRFLLSKF